MLNRAELETGMKPIEAADSRFFVVPEVDENALKIGPHILGVQQFNPLQLDMLFNRADELRDLLQEDAGRRELAAKYMGNQLCSLFYEPSTRTRLSFEQAGAKMGLGVVSTENAREFSSAAKGETIEDSIKVLNEYDFRAIVLRHHETGSAAKAAAVSDAPIINAGDGKGEHPTQALLDTYTIQHEKGRLENLHVVMGGDLKHGRTVRSLSQLLAKFRGNHISFVSTPDLRMESDVLKTLDAHGTIYDETLDMEEALCGVMSEADVVYWTRTQTERFEKSDFKSGQETVAELEAALERVRKSNLAATFMIDAQSLEFMRKDAVIMHPLPRVGEITLEVDKDPRAKYFQQAGNGLYVRMALLDTIFQQS